MDSKTQPLLTDVEANLGRPENSPSAPDPQAEHVCARCSAQLEPRNGKEVKITWRLILILLANFFAITMFSLVVAQMAEARRASVVGVLAALWATSTVVVLGLLLYTARRPGHKLGRTIVQIYVLCALAFTWILSLVGMITQNTRECAWHWYRVSWGNGRMSSGHYVNTVSCALFTSADVLTWFLIITLLGAAYATYRRAITMHGTSTTMVSVATWRLANAGEAEGAIKI
ncbi:hypothetical protein MSAN_00657300 [Mycena sanguinolenta]|uniref:Uncharacterized protein n=1 Tax=Mycena sanguinolenta TaxID=230812 RepID=A0A8H6Z3P6_9AGAR|nr:hypothetical protein MSAN_00657300 [Mycena sanguinolenta]